MLKSRGKALFKQFVQEGWLEVLVLLLKGKHLSEKFGKAMAISLFLEKGGVADVAKLLIEEVVAELLQAHKDLDYSIHVAVIVGVLKTHHSEFTIWV